MAEALQYQETPQCIGLPPSGSGNHHLDGPKTDHALTFNMGQLNGADQDEREHYSRDFAGIAEALLAAR
jgi:hypothetical protein